MKAIQVAILVAVGALGALLFTKLQTKQEAPPAQSSAVQTTPANESAASAPAAGVRTPPAQAEPQPRSPFTSESDTGRRKSARKNRVVPSETESRASNTPPVQVTTPSTPAPAATPSEPPPAAAQSVAPTPVPEPPPPPRKATLQAGALIPVRLVETLASDRNQVGDTFTATLDKPLVVDGFVVAERGSKLEGRVVESRQAGRVKGLGAIAIELTQLRTSDGQRVTIETEQFEKVAPTSTGSDAAKVGAGAAIGAAIGAIAGGGKGAAIGAGVGGAAGTGGVLATRCKPAVLPTETQINFRLKNSVTLTEKTRS
jgi:hypothetical protein